MIQSWLERFYQSQFQILKKKLTAPNWILFTSRNGVRAFFYNMKFNDTDIRCLAKIRFGVVGKATEQELRIHQIKADLVPDEQTGAGLAKALKSRSVTRRKSVYFLQKRPPKTWRENFRNFAMS